jgi:hypothetical protein
MPAAIECSRDGGPRAPLWRGSLHRRRGLVGPSDALRTGPRGAPPRALRGVSGTARGRSEDGMLQRPNWTSFSRDLKVDLVPQRFVQLSDTGAPNVSVDDTASPSTPMGVVQRADGERRVQSEDPSPMEHPRLAPRRQALAAGLRPLRWWQVGVALTAIVAFPAVLSATAPWSSRPPPAWPSVRARTALDDAHLPTVSPEKESSPFASHLAGVRTDALIVRMATQPSAGVAPSDGAVTIFAYDYISILKGSTGVVRVALDAVKSRALLAVLNRLPRRPSGHCMDNALVYRLSIRVPGQRAMIDVDGWACDATVSLTVGSSPRPTLNDVSCALLHTVISDLPANVVADGTRHASVGCRREVPPGGP